MLRRAIILMTGLLCLSLFVFPATTNAANWTWTNSVYPGVDYATRPHVSGKTDIHLIRIDNNYVGVTITPYVTAQSEAGQKTSNFAKARELQVAINAGFYNTSNYAPCSIVVSNGTQWTNSNDSALYGQFGYTADGRAKYIDESPIASTSQYPWMHHVVSGMPVLVKSGAVVANLHSSAACADLGHCNSARARTAVGVSSDARYTYLVTVEESASQSSGMTINQLAALMVEVGAHWALNLDGGGSTTMHVEALGGMVGQVQGGTYQRTVSNHLGFYVESTLPDYVCKQAAVDNPSALFQDIPAGSWQEPIASAIYEAGVTNGCSSSPMLFCPNCGLKRAHSAVFLARALQLSPYDNPTPTFDDVPPSDPNYGVIEALVRARVIAGCSETSFCPEALLSRSAAAALIARAYDLRPELYEAVAPSFSDVAAGHWAFTFIEALKHNCVTSGCANGLYCPNEDITRIEFVTFIARMMRIGGQSHCVDDNPLHQVEDAPDAGEPDAPSDSEPLDPEPLEPEPLDPEPVDPGTTDAELTAPDAGADPLDEAETGDPAGDVDATPGSDAQNSGRVGAPPMSSCGAAGQGGAPLSSFALCGIALCLALRRR